MAEPTIIIGGAGGIGSALAQRLRGRGEAVHLIGRDEERLTALADEIGADDSIADMTDPAAIAAAIGGIAAAGPIRGLVYAAGTITVKPLGSLSAAIMQDDFAVNALGAALALQAALPGLKASAGQPAVVFFSTVAVRQGFTGHVSIAMAKGAVEGLTLAAAAELAPKIRVNCIAPSLTRTPLAAAMTSSPQFAAAVAEAHALRRLGEPDDAAALAAFLLSDEAGWITGQVMGVDGGRSSLRTKG